MIKNQVKSTLRKPAVIIKLVIVTLLFLPSLIGQLSLIIPFAREIDSEAQVTVPVVLIHMFDYFTFYVDVLFIGFILLIPDIVRNEYTEKQCICRSNSRNKAGLIAIARIMVLSVIYVAWFAILTVILSGMVLHNFSSEWPDFIKLMLKSIPIDSGYVQTFIMVPKSALDYPVWVVVFLMLLRSTIGFIFLGMLACFVTLVTNKLSHGVSVIIFLVAMSYFWVLDFSNAVVAYFNPSSVLDETRKYIDMIKLTIVPLFTFRSVTDDFVYWMIYGISVGIILSLLMGTGIMLYFKKGDFGNADRIE